jgi:predicted negative regulator of RcsB-dependent stress response
MKEGLLIGGGIVVAGVFVGYAAYKLVQKNSMVLNSIKKKASNVAKKTSQVASDAKRAFAEGFKDAQAKTATA